MKALMIVLFLMFGTVYGQKYFINTVNIKSDTTVSMPVDVAWGLHIKYNSNNSSRIFVLDIFETGIRHDITTGKKMIDSVRVDQYWIENPMILKDSSITFERNSCDRIKMFNDGSYLIRDSLIFIFHEL